MNTIGIILSILVGLVVSYIVFQMIYEYIWNKRLKSYQKLNNITHVKTIRYVLPLRRSLIAVTSIVILFVFIVTGTFDLPQIYRDKQLLNARIAGSESALREKLSLGNGYRIDVWSGIDAVQEDSVGNNAPSSEAPDVVGTNIQVDGVDEADIVKTDGYEIFYKPQYQSNRIYKFNVETDGTLTQLPGLEFSNVYVQEFYLTDDYLVIIGYKEELLEQYFDQSSDALMMPDYYFYGYRYTSTVMIYDRDTLTLNFEVVTNGDIQTHRIIDNILYLVLYNNLHNTGDLRPSFESTYNNQTQTSYVDYNEILIFDGIPAYAMTTVTSLNLDTYEMHHETVVGASGYLYMTKDAIYIAGIYTYYHLFGLSVSSGTHIIKFNLDHQTGIVNYAGSKLLQGYVLNQFWMDEYRGNLRVVTSLSWGNLTDKNRLYILKENPETDALDQIGLLDEGIGKPEERVTAVRFDGNVAYVVTFRNTDPLYTIDLSNLKDIKILNEVEEPGYNTYLHVWGPNHLVGIGYDANFNVKISVYGTTNTTEPLETYLISQPVDGEYQWSYSEALHNHKAILISPSHGFVAFAANKYSYNTTTHDYVYTSVYYLFYIDFEGNPIIQEPFMIEHETTNYANQIDRGIYINNIFYTFSSSAIVTFNGTTKLVEHIYLLSNPEQS